MLAIMLRVSPKQCQKLREEHDVFISKYKFSSLLTTSLLQPIKVYIYESDAKTDDELDWYETSDIVTGAGISGDQYEIVNNWDTCNGKVIGEFICTSIVRSKDKTILVIDSIKFYPVPKWVDDFKHLKFTDSATYEKYLEKPPSTWMYVIDKEKQE